MSRIEDYNYYGDLRTQGPAQEPKLFIWNEELDDHEEVELPTKWGVCDVCDGEGVHVNPSIDCGGISDEFDYDPDFRENYMSGMYDVQCSCCEGRRVVRVVDYGAMSPEYQEAWDRQCEEEAYSRAESMAERRMGA